jgi:hypothetical protein
MMESIFSANLLDIMVRPMISEAAISRRLKKLYPVVDLSISITTGTNNRTWTCVIVIYLSVGTNNPQKTF